MTCVSSSNRKVRGKKWFLLNQVFLVCISWTQRGMDCCLCQKNQLQKNPHSCFPFLETERSPALGIRPLGPECCDALPSSWHTSWAVRAGSGSHASAAAVPAPLPGHRAPSGRRKDQPPGSAQDSSSGASGHDQIIHTIIMPSASLSPFPPMPHSL